MHLCNDAQQQHNFDEDSPRVDSFVRRVENRSLLYVRTSEAGGGFRLSPLSYLIQWGFQVPLCGVTEHWHTLHAHFRET